MKTTILCALLLLPLAVYAQDAQMVQLPAPDTQGGVPLMQALKQRASSREFSQKDVPLQVVSDLLWAAAGVNRPETGQRTSPTAKNKQEIDVYVARADGLYLYDARAHALARVLAEDVRALTGTQPFVKDAPLNLIFVVDYAKMGGQDAESDLYAATDTGFVSQNVYLYCASAGLATVVRGWLDRPALAKAMHLRPDQKIILAQTVGYPQEQ